MSTVFTNFTSPFIQLDGSNGYLINVEGSPVETNLNFTPGKNISISYNSNTGEFEISAIADSLSVQDEGNPVSSGAALINFVGSGVTASEPVQGVVEVSIPGSSAAVDSVNSLTGDVVLDPDDLDDNSSVNKFISQPQLDKLANIEDGAQVNPSLSELNSLRIDAGAVNGYTVETAVPFGAVFTDTTYTIGDGGLTQFNFNAARRGIVDLFAPSNPQAGETLVYNGENFVNNLLSYSDLSGTPNLSPVATSGDYSDLSNTPSVPSSSDELTEGTNNLFYSDALVKNYLQAGSGVSLSDSGQNLEISVSFPVNSVNGETGDVVLNPDDLDDSSSTNKFVSQPDLNKLNLLLTQNTSPSQGEALVFNGDNYVNRKLDYSEIANTPALPTPFSGNYQDLSNKPFIPSSTDDLSEGDNLFFTEGRSFSVLGSALIPGSNISISSDSSNNKVTISSLIPVESVNGKTGDVVLSPDDLDDSSSTNKFIPQPQLDKLSNIEAGAQVNPPLSELNSLGIDAGTVNGYTVETSVPTGAVFTDTTYTIGDGGLTQFNFNAARRDIVDLFSPSNPQAGETLLFNGSLFVNQTLDSSVLSDSNSLLKSSQVVDNLSSLATDKPLSSNQGRILNQKIDSLGEIIVTPDQTSRDNLTGLSPGDIVHVVDSGNGTWQRWQIISVTDGSWATSDKVEFISQDSLGISLLVSVDSGNIVSVGSDSGIYLSASDIKTAYESLPDTNPFTDNNQATVQSLASLSPNAQPSQVGQTLVFNGNNYVNRKLDYSEIANTPVLPTTFSGDYQDLSNKPSIPSDTDDLNEGSNLFFTDDRSFSVLSSALIPGSNINLSVDSLNREITLSALIPISSVNGETGDVVLNPDDLDDSSSANKFITNSQLNKLANIEAGAQVNPSLSELNSLRIDAGAVNGYTVETAVPFGAVFTDTTYTIGDGGLTQFNFNAARREIVDLLSPNNSPQVNQTLIYNGINFVNGFIPYNSISGTPNLSPVATSGDYSDLSNTPSVPSSSDELTEGTNNLFYSDALVKNYLQAGSGVSLSDSGQNLEISVSFPVNSVNGETGDIILSPDDLDDSTSLNKFVSQPDLDKLNLLLTQNTPPSQGEALVFNGNNYVNRKLNYSEIANTPDLSSVFSGNYQDLSNKPLIPSSTDDLSEGNNKFLTFDRVFDDLNSILLNGDNISFNSDGSSFIEIDAVVPVDSVNGRTGDVVLTPDDLDDTNSNHKFVSAQEKAKLNSLSDQAVEELAAIAGVEPIADIRFDKIREGVFSSPHSFPTGIDFSRNSSATRINAKGVVESVPPNYPRIDYDPLTGENLGLLIEPSSTNLLFPSDVYPWQTNNITLFTTLSNPAPYNGDFGSYRVDDLSNNSLFTIIDLPSDTFCFSFYLNTSDSFDRITVSTGSDYTIFNLQNLTTLETTNSFSTIEPLKDGWFRLAVTFTGESNCNISISFDRQNFGAISDFVFPGGFQLEKSNFPTSYIPTQSNSVTREADVVSIPSLASDLNQFGVRSTFRPSFIDGVNKLLTMPSSKDLFLYISGSTLILFLDGNNNSLFGVQSGLEQAIAFSFDKGSFRLAFEGGVSTTASGSNFDFSDLEISGTGSPTMGHLSRFTFFPSAINNLDKLSLV